MGDSIYHRIELFGDIGIPMSESVIINCSGRGSQNRIQYNTQARRNIVAIQHRWPYLEMAMYNENISQLPRYTSFLTWCYTTVVNLVTSTAVKQTT